MRHLESISNKNFYQIPMEFNKYTKRNLLKYAMGANLYMNALMDLYNKTITVRLKDICTITICFEDAIKESEVGRGERNVLEFLDKIYDELISGKTDENSIPLIFIRVRNPSQFISFTSKLSKNQLGLIAGFTFPKFNKENATIYLEHLEKVNKKFHEKIYGMPILESEEIIYKENRMLETIYLKDLLAKYKDFILNIRVGGTDFSSIFGLRRKVSSSVYDINVVNDCLTDIINIFGRSKDGYVISAPVWEYFSSDINSNEVKGLIREIELDKENGFCGKTIIHPTQGIYVDIMHAVEFEEYIDAKNILKSAESGGVFKGYNGNKMNEILPHYNWAKEICNRGKIFGVLNKDISFDKLFLEMGAIK
ncbi:HpcH/HpaI aldolase/citrate lyase family protein [Clostridium senegalense]|uniref:HpcH/HpaI aldolase/citrate lyase family protein n=1 Tax=Clostridium senegalense TaxID=1465809 RepID=UPI001C120673|nr:HpcH/HpaI aldolase/citrate lyase family protein [Clostridium senegalense]MBU5226000.1 HpcH/HpaI aldolase/citrate lyase family protein [Clostridium senegalense]